MRGKNTIIINGRSYDAVTGRPIAADATAVSRPAPKTTPSFKSVKKVISDFGPAISIKKAAPKASPTVAKKVRSADVPAAVAVHQKPQRSQTLNRRAIKKPQPIAKKASVTRSPMITRFALHPQTAKKIEPDPKPVSSQQPKQSSDKAVATKATSTPASATVAAVTVSDSRQLKERLIKQRLSEADNNHHKATKQRGLKKLIKNARARHVVAMCSALVLIGAYLTFINMPNLSVRVASSRAGVAASYPEYHPDGYSFAGPVAYAPGEVTLKFKSNSSKQGFEVKQRASNWDSQAVLDNVVAKESNSYLTYSEQGLTIYTYGKKAAWVNGGVLYTINGDAPLSSEQILHIATSL